MLREREAVYDTRVPADHWIILRLDGRGFSGLTEKHFAKPFDPLFHQHMLKAAETTLVDLQARFAYVGSDEISLLLPPVYSSYDRRMEKLVSIPASMASSAFTLASTIAAQFDCRINSAISLEGVLAYFRWRLADVERNALSTLAYWTLRADGMSARQATARLKEASWQDKERLLQEHSLDFHQIPSWQRSGIGIAWETYDKQGYDPICQITVTAQRRRTATVDIAAPGAYVVWLMTYLEEVAVAMR